MTAKVPLKVHLRLRFQNLGKPRTAGLCGRAAGACDCGPLSCAKIERPPPLEKPSCKVWLFAQDRSREYRQKVTATTPSQTAFHRVFQLLAQTAHVCFHSRKRVHTRLSEKNRTQGHTRRNRGVLDGGGITTLGSFCADRKPCVARGGRTANFAAFGSWPGVLPKNAESLRNSDALMRVAVPRRRGPAGLRGLFSFLTKLRLVRPIPETSFSSPDAPACAVPAQAAFPLALSRLGAVQGFSVLSLCLTPFLDFGDKKGR